MRTKAIPMAMQNICLMVLCVWALTPQLGYSVTARALSMGSVAVWIFIEINRPRGVVLAPTKPVLLMSVYSIYTIFLEMQTHGASGIISSIQLYIMLFFLLAQQSRRNSMESLYPVFWLVVGLNVIWFTSTLTFLSTVDARAMRVLVRSTAEAAEISSQGVGGYSMAYGAVLMLPVLTLLSFKPDLIGQLRPPKFLLVFPLLPKIVIWYLTLISIALVVLSQFSIAVLAMTFVLISTLAMWKFTATRLLVVIFSAIFLLVWGQAILIDALIFASQVTEGTNYYLKINDLLSSLQLEDAAGTFGDRIDRYLRSLALFWGSPLLGTLYYTDLGKHSTLLDGFARWGVVFGGILLYLVSFLQLRAFRALYFVPGGAGTAIGTLVAVLLVLGLNKHFMGAGIAIFIVYPVVFHLLRPTSSKCGMTQGRGAVHA